MKEIKIRNYLFHDKTSGEDFLVESLTEETAYIYAYQYFETPKLISEVSDFEAEMMGLDTY